MKFNWKQKFDNWQSAKSLFKNLFYTDVWILLKTRVENIWMIVIFEILLAPDCIIGYPFCSFLLHLLSFCLLNHAALTHLLSVFIARRSSVSQWCSMFKAAWCFWSHHIKWAIWDTGAYITVPCEYSFYLALELLYHFFL